MQPEVAGSNPAAPYIDKNSKMIMIMYVNERSPHPSEDFLPSYGFDFNYLGRWYNGTFIGNENIRKMNPEQITDYDLRKNILSKGIWSNSIETETREALLQALLIAIDKIDGTERINN